MGYSDYANKEKYSELLRFNSSNSKSDEELTSLKEYCDRMKSGQKEIYYISGASREAINSNPHFEIFKNKELEVLFLFDPLDEFVMDALREYKTFALKSVEQIDAKSLEKFDDIHKKGENIPELSKDEEKTFDKLLKRIKEILGDKITEVKVSNRLTDSPACLVNPADGMTSQMQKIFQIVSKDTSVPKKIFEVNKDHKLIRNLLKIYSVLLEGYINDPYKIVNGIKNLLEKSSDWHKSVKN
jgi:molecular chaperone HtpG